MRPAHRATSHAVVNNLTTDTGIFEYAAQKWAVDNLGSLPWNQSGSTTPITYAPRLVYDGNPALCYGSQGLTASNLGGSPVDLTQQQTPSGNAFLPATFRAPYAGTYCGVVVPNATTTTVNGATVPVAGVQAIFVPSHAASLNPLLKTSAPALFAAVHGAQGNAQNYVLDGAAILQQGSASAPSWSAVALSGGSGVAASFMIQPLSAMGFMSGVSNGITSAGAAAPSTTGTAW